MIARLRATVARLMSTIRRAASALVIDGDAGAANAMLFDVLEGDQ